MGNGAGFRVQGSGFRVQGSGFKVPMFRFQVSGFHEITLGRCGGGGFHTRSSSLLQGEGFEV